MTNDENTTTNEPTDEIEELIKQLKDGTKEERKSLKQKEIITDENVNQYIFDKIGQLITGGVVTVEALKESMLSSFDSRDVESFAELFKAVTSAIDVLNKVNIQNKKAQSAKELKELDLQNTSNQLQSGNTNVLIATREDIFRNFILEDDKKHKNKDIQIEEYIEVEEIDESDIPTDDDKRITK